MPESSTHRAPSRPGVHSLALPLDRDQFLRSLLRELSGTLQDVVGIDRAAGFISVVGQRLGDEIHAQYRQALGVERIDRAQLGGVLVDLKRRIEGDFYVIDETPEKIVFGNRRCPFGEKVLGRPSLCMMTSNVFGVIAAETVGRSKVVLHETIASGAAGCRVTVHLGTTADGSVEEGREYYRG